MTPWPSLPITRAQDALIVAQLRPLRRQSGMKLAGPAAKAWNAMDAAAEADGVTLWLASAYRTWESQARLLATKGRYNSGTNPYGAAPPGYSNHQLGRSADVQTNGNPNHPAILWLRRNASRFGFVNDVSTEWWHWTWYGTDPLDAGDDDMLTDDQLVDLIDQAPQKRLNPDDLHESPLVAHIQRACNLAAVDPPLKVDGVYGPKAAAGVAQIEARLGWKQDGIVGRPLALRFVKGPIPAVADSTMPARLERAKAQAAAYRQTLSKIADDAAKALT